MCYEEKSVFYALKWLPYYHLKASVALLCPENSLSFTYPLLKKSSRLSSSKTKKIPSFKKICFFLPCVFSPKIMIKKNPSARCSVLLFYMTAHFFFFMKYLVSFFLMHMDIESACMWLTLETSLRCIRVLFGK